ncbi:Zn-dependent hydrolase [Consotaella aegiceratis]|uniref:Zn-dependent hydrolase n=1 Tax=Consotaella aegiceratis TaxID=3097961 RepID=UPI002F401CF9
MKTVAVDQNRLLDRIADFGTIGALEGGGVCRLALTNADKVGRDKLVAQMRELDLAVSVDPIGNIFGTRAGRTAGPCVMLGSHIDSVATGGLYDGTLGVLGGLEVVAALNEAGVETERPITVAAFTNEEGARFAPDMLGSLVHVGGLSLAEALDTVSIDGRRLGDELTRIGYAGEDQGPLEIAAYFELHIEQGPILEAEGIEIGVVAGVQGISWSELTITGRSAHAGTTPLHLRHDAGLAAALIAGNVDKIAREIGSGQVGTVGALTLSPNLVNVVAEKAVMTVDLRNPDETLLQQAEARLAECIESVVEKARVTVDRRTLARFEPVAFAPELVDAVEAEAHALGLSTKRLYSGAGHDAQMIARIAPAAMIFVPCVDGISHNVTEYTKPADLVNGVNVLLQLTLKQAAGGKQGDR